MVAAVRGCEGEAAGRGSLLIDDTMVVVEDFFDGYLDGGVWGGGGCAGSGVVLFGCVVACEDCMSAEGELKVHKCCGRKTVEGWRA